MKINWKGSLIALGITVGAIGVGGYISYSQSTQDTPKTEYSVNGDMPYDNSSDITADNTSSDNSAFVNDDYMKDTQKVKPAIGMTVSEVDNSTWGRAGDITTTKTAYGESQLWIYQDGRSLFFDNGVLESITE
jgi:hypothetical protein